MNAEQERLPILHTYRWVYTINITSEWKGKTCQNFSNHSTYSATMLHVMLYYVYVPVCYCKRNENLFQKLSINKILRYFLNVYINIWMGIYKIGMAFLIHLIHLLRKTTPHNDQFCMITLSHATKILVHQ